MARLYELVREALLKRGPQSPLLRASIRLQARANGCAVREGGSGLELTRGPRRMVLPAGQYLMVPYALHMWESLFETIVPEPRDGCATLDFSAPKLHQYARTGLRLWAPGMVEEDSMDAYTAAFRPQSGDTVWDVGAHGGFTTYCFSKMVGPKGRVYAFEPDGRTYEYLLRNIELHRLENVVPVPKALSGTTGTALFSMDGSLGAGLTAYTHTADRSVTAEVETLSMGDACREFGVPALVKMDIEGAEVAAIRGGLPVLREHPVAFAIETEHRVDREYTSVPIEAMLRGIGYRAWTSSEFGGQQFTWAMPPGSA